MSLFICIQKANFVDVTMTVSFKREYKTGQ